MSLVGSAKPAGFARLQDENGMLKSQLLEAKKQLAEISKSASKPDPAITAELERMRQQIVTLADQLSGAEAAAIRRLADADQKARERLQFDQQAVDKVKVSLAEQRAAIEAGKASLATQQAVMREEGAALAEQKAEIQKWQKHLANEYSRLKDQQGELARSLSLEERQQAIINGDMSSITQSLVADIARLENDAALARERMLAADKAHSSVQREERSQWHTIYANATRELRAARQQLIQLPRPASADPRAWKDNLVELIANAMEQGNISPATIREFVSRSTGMLAQQDVRRVITSKSAERARKEQSVPH